MTITVYKLCKIFFQEWWKFSFIYIFIDWLIVNILSTFISIELGLNSPAIFLDVKA